MHFVLSLFLWVPYFHFNLPSLILYLILHCLGESWTVMYLIILLDFWDECMVLCQWKFVSTKIFWEPLTSLKFLQVECPLGPPSLFFLIFSHKWGKQSTFSRERFLSFVTRAVLLALVNLSDIRGTFSIEAAYTLLWQFFDVASGSSLWQWSVRLPWKSTPLPTPGFCCHDFFFFKPEISCGTFGFSERYCD